MIERDARAKLPPTMVPEYITGNAPAAQRGDDVAASARSYYDYAPLKQPHWKPYIPMYFFVGGISAGAQLVASLALLFGGARDRAVVRTGSYLAAPLIAIGQLLLIVDLGRRERAHFMFRVFKTRSPMSLGSWGLLVFSALSGAGFLRQLLEDLPRTRGFGRALRPLGAVVSAMSIVPSLFVGGYTGALLSATAMPLWAKARAFLAPLFLSSAVATGTSAIAVVAAPRAASTRRALATTTVAALGAELGLELAMEGALGEGEKHLASGPDAPLHRVGQIVGLALPLALLVPSLSGRGPTRERLLAASLSALAGSALMRYSITSAGKRSADDAATYWDWT